MSGIILPVFLMLFLAQIAEADQDQTEVQETALKGPYLGQTPPELTPQPFAPGVVSKSDWEASGVFSPNMQEFYFIRDHGENTPIEFVVFENKGNTWRERVISPRVGSPFISPDGKIMHLGRRYKERTLDGWSEIKSLGSPFEDIRIMRMTSSATGTYVFDEANPEGRGTLRFSKLVDGKREAPQPLPKEINTGRYNAHPFIAPDESYIMWDGQRSIEGRNADIFISFRKENGSWGKAIKMGDTINTEESEGEPRVTPDGKYLFFNRMVDRKTFNADIFWVSAQIIEELRPRK
jgi:hypothetical protein